MNRIELKEKSKQQIKGKIGILFVIALIIGIISFLASLVLSFIPIVGSLISSLIITPAFALSLVRIYINITMAESLLQKMPFADLMIFGQHLKYSSLLTSLLFYGRCFSLSRAS